MFDFLRSPPNGPRVMTGHAGGLITINVEEADDAKREQIQHDLREPYRDAARPLPPRGRPLLLGPDGLGHQVAANRSANSSATSAPATPRRSSGTTSRGHRPNWAKSYISSYATMHPWEDWAETWAHYLHVVDSLGTAMGFGLDAGDLDRDIQPFTRDALYAPDDPNAERFLSLLNAWLAVTMVLNEMARSMGQPDFYPFVMSKPVVAKLQFIQMAVADSRSNPEL